ncbi:MAG: alpha/beta hydrolase [Rhodobacter sp.]|nr:alpha/beta hydrolase [Paracoccaceae bacterium]MCC0075230.1 alpha/beta hydrolase [Rhodobacter sp.]
MAEWRDHLTGGISWRERPGDGPVLVCLHGIGSRAFGWQALAECLPGWRVIAWDAPGYGKSVPLTVDWPVARDYAQALEGLTNVIGLTKFHLVGHSLGTLIGASYARNYPQAAKSLTLTSCAQGGGVTPGAALAAAHQARINDLQEVGAEKFSEIRSPRLVYRPEANPALVAQVRAAMATVTLPGYAQAVRMLAAGDLTADCAEISTGTAVVVGAEDIVTPPAQSERAFAALKNPRGLTVVPGCGHALPLQAPLALAQIIRAQAETCADQGATP